MTELLPEYQNVVLAQVRAKRVRESGFGMPIDVHDAKLGVFWSKGWRGCECGKRLDDWTITLRPFLERQGIETRMGWRCF